MITVRAPGTRSAMSLAIRSSTPSGPHRRCSFHAVPVTFSPSVFRPMTGMPAAIARS